MLNKYVIEGLGNNCPLCIEVPAEGRVKEKKPPVFVVSCDGGYSGPVCAPHLAALIKAAEQTPSSPPRVEAKVAEVKPAQPVAAVPVAAVPAHEAVKK